MKQQIIHHGLHGQTWKPIANCTTRSAGARRILPPIRERRQSLTKISVRHIGIGDQKTLR